MRGLEQQSGPLLKRSSTLSVEAALFPSSSFEAGLNRCTHPARLEQSAMPTVTHVTWNGGGEAGDHISLPLPCTIRRPFPGYLSNHDVPKQLWTGQSPQAGPRTPATALSLH
jgi:hypothetical protein